MTIYKALTPMWQWSNQDVNMWIELWGDLK